MEQSLTLTAADTLYKIIERHADYRLDSVWSQLEIGLSVEMDSAQVNYLESILASIEQTRNVEILKQQLGI